MNLLCHDSDDTWYDFIVSPSELTNSMNLEI